MVTGLRSSWPVVAAVPEVSPLVVVVVVSLGGDPMSVVVVVVAGVFASQVLMSWATEGGGSTAKSCMDGQTA